MPKLRKWQKRIARLAGMSGDELHTRGRQEVAKRLDLARYRCGVSFENSSSLSRLASSRNVQFFFSTGEAQTIADMLRDRLPDEAERIVSTAHKVCRHRFQLLGYDNVAYGDKIDWHFDPIHQKRAPLLPWYRVPHLNCNEVGDARIIWELNRHQHLVTLAKAHLLTHDVTLVSELFRQWYKWQEENPYPIGINWASSLEVAVRSLSWLWVRHLLGDSGEMPVGFASELSHALAVNGRHIEKYLSTYSSPNTHLLGEGIGLFFIGILCPEIPAAPRWREQGWEIVCREADRQVRGDGMHFEKSTYYHIYALDFFLHARILAARNEIAIPLEFDQVLQRMMDFLCGISQAGIAPRFGDDDGGRVFDPSRNRANHLLDPLATGAILFHRADWKMTAENLREETLWLLGPQALAEFEHLDGVHPAARTIRFAESGVYVLADSDRLRQQLVIDAGPQGVGNSGHGHADALSVHLSIDGREWLTDPGTYSYLGEPDTREAFRATAAHNTLQVDGVSQAAPTGPFSWECLPEVRVDLWKAGGTFAFFEGHHTGYGRLSKPVIHHRSIFYVKSRFWVIRDVAEGEGNHQLDLFWHLAPGTRLNARVGSALLFGTSHDSGLALLVSEKDECSEKVIPGWHSPVYGQKEPAPVLRFSKFAALPAGYTTLLLPLQKGESELGRLADMAEPKVGRNLYSCAYYEKDETHQWVFSKENIPWQLGPLASNARVLYCRLNSTGKPVHVVACDGSFVRISGRSFFELREVASIYEWQDKSVATEVSEDGKAAGRRADLASRLSVCNE